MKNDYKTRKTIMNTDKTHLRIILILGLIFLFSKMVISQSYPKDYIYPDTTIISSPYFLQPISEPYYEQDIPYRTLGVLPEPQYFIERVSSKRYVTIKLWIDGKCTKYEIAITDENNIINLIITK